MLGRDEGGTSSDGPGDHPSLHSTEKSERSEQRITLHIGAQVLCGGRRGGMTMDSFTADSENLVMRHF